MAARVMIGAVLLAASWRGWWLVDRFPTPLGPSPQAVRELCFAHDFRGEAMLASPLARVMGLERAQRLVLDPDASVFICPGDDLQPGKANVDDDADGVVDNASELGAMYSDDVCLAPTDDGYRQALKSGTCKVIDRGAYVFDNGQSDDRPSRLRLSGQLHGRAWERMVVEREKEGGDRRQETGDRKKYLVKGRKRTRH